MAASLETKPPLPVTFPQHFPEPHEEPHLRCLSAPSARDDGDLGTNGDREQFSLSTAHHRTGLQNVGRISVRLLKQICGLNPFRTSYASLFRPLQGLTEYGLLVSGIVLALAAGAPLPIIGLIFGRIIDSFPLPEDELRTRLGQLLATACAFFAVTWGWSICWGLIGERLSRSLRVQTLERLLGMDQAYYETEAPDVTGLLTEKIQTIQLGTSEKVGLFLSSISYFIAAFAVGFYLDAKLAGILLATVIPAMASVITVGSTLSSRFSKRAISRAEKATSIAENLIANVRTVQATGSVDVLCKEHQRELDWKRHWGFRKALVGAVMLGSIYFIAYSANALAFYLGSREVGSRQSGGAGTVYAVVFLILDASFVVGQFGPFIQTFALAAVAGESLFALLDRPSPFIDTYSTQGTAVEREHFKCDIELRDINFVYPSRPSYRALDELHLTLKSGTTTGIVGSSGSGKSTIANLLMRLYDPSSGSIRLGSLDFRACKISSLRSHIALVGQEPVLFRGTIMENIRSGVSKKPRTTQAQVDELCIAAAHDAGCDGFIQSLPLGYDTEIGSTGFSQLSGGQRQRLALARAIVGRPALLILDEYTSAMDATSEALVLERLRERLADCTVVIIAHRLATVRHCHQIVLMQDGRVVDKGSHEQLVNKDGPYRALVDAQMLSNVEDNPSDEVQQAASKSLSTPTSSRNTSPMTTDSCEAAKGSIKVAAVTDIGLRQALVHVLSLSKSSSPLLILGLVAAAVSGGTLLGEAVIFGHLIEILNNPDTPSARADFFCLMFFIVAIAALAAHCTSGYSFGIVSERLISTVQKLAIHSILAQDMEWFSATEHSPHHLVSSLSADSGKMSGLSGPILGTVVSATTSVVGGIILAHIVAWKMAIVLLACVPVMLLSGFFRLKVLAKSEDRQQNAYRAATALASEACSNIRTVASLGSEPDVLLQFHRELDAPYKKNIKFMALGNVLLAFSLSITYFIYALAYWWQVISRSAKGMLTDESYRGSRLVRKKEYTQLQFFIVLPALLFSAQAAGLMLSLGPELTQAAGAARRMFALLDTKPTIIDNARSGQGPLHNVTRRLGTPVQGRPHIQLSDVSLAYAARPGVMALTNVSLSICQGQFIALVGQSGGGKSSVISLIERFFDPTIGIVTVNDEDLRAIPVTRHRARIALVSQESELFTGSISFNVSMGAHPGQTPSHEDIVKVCQQCGLHEFIMSLPQGYSTDCGNKGSSLSGGQKQRLAIARALVRDPEILLLDEATSQLDARSELEVREAIAEASQGRTVIMVAHRLASIQHADKIFVFENGQIIESGTHADLVRRRGSYAAMAQMQVLL